MKNRIDPAVRTTMLRTIGNLVASKKKRTRPRTFVLAFALVFSLLASPITSLADSVDVPSSGSTNEEVTATFTIDEDILSSLGYGVIASIPVSMPLAYDSTSKNFSKSADVYCSGVLAGGKQISVSVNESGEKFGKIYHSNEVPVSVKGKSGFDISLSKTKWSKAECYTNLSKVNNSEDATETGTLSVTIPGNGFIPSGAGTFNTYVPIIIKQEDAG